MANPNPTPKTELDIAIDAFNASTNAELFLYNGPIDDRGFWELIRQSGDGSSYSKKAILILVTNGGDPNAAFNIGRWMNSFDSFEVVVCSACKSAGTLVTIAANSIYMGMIGELGPLDVQLLKRDELFQQQSGLVYKKAIETITNEAFRTFQSYLTRIKEHSNNTVTFRVASAVAADLSSAIFAPIAAQIDPVVAGEFQRDLEVAEAYGQRLNKYGNNLKSDGLKRLVHDYPSHDFVIDMTEARTIFNRVNPIVGPIWEVVAALGSGALVPRRADRHDIRWLNPPKPQAFGPDQPEAKSDANESAINGSPTTKPGSKPAKPRKARS